MPANERSKLTILVVEDDWLVRYTVVVAFLQDADCECRGSQWETAVEVLAQLEHLDVVFTDIWLGGQVNGWDVGEADPSTA